ncbi:translation initiation factor 2 subunit alpha [Striga asiatica]|uniref:Translation initiation factor 2 subunit alpha n=1 Tax=Striga asiatica TaxID=4170 RepID=A0A5A7Q391_STRAF|nr:translation initiation factor 2 subunit alpha [Striga asiatica]
MVMHDFEEQSMTDLKEEELPIVELFAIKQESQNPPNPELKELPNHLKYVFLDDQEKKPKWEQLKLDMFEGLSSYRPLSQVRADKRRSKKQFHRINNKLGALDCGPKDDKTFTRGQSTCRRGHGS